MASINKTVSTYTHEGAKASHISDEEALRRTVMSCLLWEDNFYEDGESVADRVSKLTQAIGDKAVAIMMEAKNVSKLRHVPLWMAVALAQCGKLKANDLAEIITRADDLTEFLAMYWAKGKKPLSKQVKLGLAKAFDKFDEYQLAKYDRNGAVKLRDVIRMVHPKPTNDEQSLLWKRLVAGELATPDTWEVALSSGADKKETFTRLIRENNLGDLALLRNLRNILGANVDLNLVKEYITTRKWKYILPFQFLNAARYAPQLNELLESAMFKGLSSFDKIPLKVAILVDVSGSMSSQLSGSSDLNRLDAAKGVAIYAREMFSDVRVFKFNNTAVEVPNYHGFALSTAIGNCSGGTEMLHSLQDVVSKDVYNAVIVITDEQTRSGSMKSSVPVYVVNVGTYDRGVGYNNGFIHINGWSDNVIKFITAHLLNN